MSKTKEIIPDSDWQDILSIDSDLTDEEKLVFLEFIELDTYAILDMLTNKATDDVKYKNILLALKSLN